MPPQDISSDRCSSEATEETVVVLVAGQPVLFDRFEASRSDATADAEGSQSGAARSRPGVKPWTQVTLAEAEAACQAASARLCTRSELQAACMGRQGRPYPYGDMYVAGACNDYRGDRGAQPTGSAPRCSTPEGIADLVGNVAEWCRLDADRTPAVAGGSGKLNALAVSLNLDKCAATEQLPAEMLRADIGFRCCDRCR